MSKYELVPVLNICDGCDSGMCGVCSKADIGIFCDICDAQQDAYDFCVDGCQIKHYYTDENGNQLGLPQVYIKVDD